MLSEQRTCSSPFTREAAYRSQMRQGCWRWLFYLCCLRASSFDNAWPGVSNIAPNEGCRPVPKQTERRLMSRWRKISWGSKQLELCRAGGSVLFFWAGSPASFTRAACSAMCESAWSRHGASLYVHGIRRNRSRSHSLDQEVDLYIE